MAERVAIITGAASGIGRATTERFLADSKYQVYAVDVDPVIHTIFQSPRAIPYEADLRVRKQAEGLVPMIHAQTGRLDVVVNAAGIMIKGHRSTFYDGDGSPKQAHDDMMAVNVFAPIWIMMAASCAMRNNGGGTVVNVTSSKYLFPDPHHSEYQISKMDLSRVTQGVAKDIKRLDNVRLVDVQPGNTKTNIDRGVWTEGNNAGEIAAAESITKWWRNAFGSDPKDVAEVIYKVAEGKIDRTKIPVGLDAQIGQVLFMLTYPLAGFRLDSLFFAGSSLFYKAAGLKKSLERKRSTL